MPVRIAIHGAGGQMGRRLMALALAQPASFTLVAAVDRPDSPIYGQDAGKVSGLPDVGVTIAATLDAITSARADVVIDFSAPAATRALVQACIEHGLALVVGTTGLTIQDHHALDSAAKTIPLLQATNTSLGVNVLLRLAAQAARQLGPDYDIEIVEAHHNRKKDAPSGTAMSLAEAICAATDREPTKDLDYGRHGPDARRIPGTIGMHAIRMGDVVGEHTVYLTAPGERIELRHVASTRDTFAHGALRAAAWLSTRPPGRFTMGDVLGLSS